MTLCRQLDRVVKQCGHSDWQDDIDDGSEQADGSFRHHVLIEGKQDLHAFLDELQHIEKSMAGRDPSRNRASFSVACTTLCSPRACACRTPSASGSTKTTGIPSDWSAVATKPLPPPMSKNGPAVGN